MGLLCRLAKALFPMTILATVVIVLVLILIRIKPAPSIFQIGYGVIQDKFGIY